MKRRQGPSKAWTLEATAWYLLYFASEVAVLPFLKAWYANEGLTASQIGVIGALGNWLQLPVSFAWGLMADKLDAHRGIMVACFVGAALLRCTLLAVSGFSAILAISLAVTVLSTPVCPLADAAVVGAIREGQYGVYRKWGAVGWGAMSPVAGALIDWAGMRAAFLLSMCLMAPAAIFGWRLHAPMVAQHAARRAALGRLRGMQARRETRRERLARSCPSPVQEGDELARAWSAEAAAADGNGEVSNHSASEPGSDSETDDDETAGLLHGSGTQLAGSPTRPVSAGMQGSVGNSYTDLPVLGGKGPGLNQMGVGACTGSGAGSDQPVPEQLDVGVSLDVAHGSELCGSVHRRSHAAAALCAHSQLELAHLQSQGENRGGGRSDGISAMGPFEGGHVISQQHNTDLANGSFGSRDPVDSEVAEGTPLLSQVQLPPAAATYLTNGQARGLGRLQLQTPASAEPGSVCRVGQERHGLRLRAHTRTLWENVRMMASNPQVVLFFSTAVLLGYGFGSIDSFLFVFLQQLGATDTLMGLTLTITCVAEVPVFQAQGWLMGRLSVSALLDVTLATYAARMLAYAALPGWGSPWAVLPVEVLHGVTFGLGWGVGCSHCRRLAPPGMGATLQAVFQGCYFGLGYGLGSLVGGWVSQRAGFPVMFVTAAGVMGAGWVGLFVARRWVARKAGVTVGRS